MNDKYSFDDFREIVAKLRSEDGCPWDRAQTLQSLKACLVNETAEAVAAVNIYNQTGDAKNLCEELGDMLLQVFLQSQIAQEEGLFTLDDVIQGISQKMVRRHPHVFGEGFVDSQGEVVRKWDEIKKLEKSGKSLAQLKFQEMEVSKATAEMIAQLREETL